MQHLPFRSKRTKTNSKTKVKQRIIKKKETKTKQTNKKRKSLIRREKNWYVLAFTRWGTTLPEQSAVTALTFD